MDEPKARFLQWLDRFARVSPAFRLTIERFTYTEDELLRLKPQVEAKYRLKKKYIDGIARGA
jgi:hypothetical protein